MASNLKELPVIEPGSRLEWRQWLAENHASSRGVWLAVGKKGNSVTSLTYEEAVREALCFGWIDSVVNAFDEHRFKQLMTPRKRGSMWARTNKQRVEELIEEGLMTAAGLAAVEAAKADGSWNLLDDVEEIRIPEDLASALSQDEQAAEKFSALSDSTRKQILYWIAQAKRPETRARRIAETLRAASEGRSPR